MARSNALVPQVTQFDKADITDMETARKAHVAAHKGEAGKITMTVLAMKAVVQALKDYPQFNASIDMTAGKVIYKDYYNMGIAVDTPGGLMVPVVRDVDKKSLRELALELEEIAAKARARKLSLEEMQGATFTISNLGGIAGTGFTPIVNWPEVAILGISRGREEYVKTPEGPQWRLLTPFSLSYDHRLIDGAAGARFLAEVCKRLSDPFEMLA